VCVCVCVCVCVLCVCVIERTGILMFTQLERVYAHHSAFCATWASRRSRSSTKLSRTRASSSACARASPSSASRFCRLPHEEKEKRGRGKTTGSKLSVLSCCSSGAREVALKRGNIEQLSFSPSLFLHALLDIACIEYILFAPLSNISYSLLYRIYLIRYQAAANTLHVSNISYSLSSCSKDVRQVTPLLALLPALCILLRRRQLRLRHRQRRPQVPCAREGEQEIE